MQQINENLYELAPSVFASRFPEYEDLGNGGIIVTEEGVIVIDTDVRTVDRIFDMLAEITDKQVRYVINTHHAFDHSSANCIFAGREDVAIIGSESCREAMIAQGELNFRRWSERLPYVKKILEEKSIEVAPPNITFDHEMRLRLGGKSLELFHYGHAHSPGDIVIYLPEDQVLFAGDLLWVGFFPNVREANVPNQIKAIDRILTFPVKYYVPGHGGITEDREEIVKMRGFLASLYELIHGMVKEGKNFKEIRTIEGPLAEGHPNWRGRNFLTTAIEVIYLSLTAPKV
jgi:cyclase